MIPDFNVLDVGSSLLTAFQHSSNLEYEKINLQTNLLLFLFQNEESLREDNQINFATQIFGKKLVSEIVKSVR